MTTTLRQKTSFGPGVYRGHKFTAERLKRFADSTNRAIKAGVPIPLLKLHAPINASDIETEEFAKQEGAGWITKVDVEADGSLAFEAKSVPADVAKQVNDGTMRFTSPEFRDHYECEKKDVYAGEIIRHFAFTPKPGNPHQGPITTETTQDLNAIALEEERSGCYQFAEYEREPLPFLNASKSGAQQHSEGAEPHPHSVTGTPFKKGFNTGRFLGSSADHAKFKEALAKHGGKDTGYAGHFHIPIGKESALADEGHSTTYNHKAMHLQYAEGTEEGYAASGKYPKHTADCVDDPDHATNNNLKAGSKDGSVDEETLMDNEEWFTEDAGKKQKRKKTKQENKDDKGDSVPETNNKDPEQLKKPTTESQHAEKPPFAKQKSDDKEEGDKKIPEATDDPAETGGLVDIVTPESPPVAAANPDAQNPDMPPKATDRTKLSAVLAGFNQKGIVLPSDFDFTAEAAIDILLAALNSSIKAENEAEAEKPEEEESPAVTESSMPFQELEVLYNKRKDEQNKPVQAEQFTEAELQALPEKARVKLVAALAAERKQREEAEARALQFKEQERYTKNNAARDKAVHLINKAAIPPALKEKLILNYTTLQFNEGAEPKTYSPSEVAALVASAIPKSLQFLEEAVTEADTPVANTVSGVDEKGKPVLGPTSSEQFFEKGNIPSGHITPERARELIASGPYKFPARVGAPQSPAELVQAENQRVPNNVMKR